MPTAHSTPHGKTARRSAASKSKTTAKKTSQGASKDAVTLLKADHREVEKMFDQFQKARDDGRKEQLAEQICQALRVHTQIEEELVYPTAREFLKDDEIVNESLVEHQAAKDLIEQLEAMGVSDEMFDAKMQVLQEQVEHHVQEEEKELFPQLQKTDMDLKAIGQQLMTRKQEVMRELGGEVRSTH